MSSYLGKTAIVVQGGTDVPGFVRKISEAAEIPIITGDQYSPEAGYSVVLAHVPGQQSAEGQEVAEDFIAFLGQNNMPVILLTNRSIIKKPGPKKPEWPTRVVRKNVAEVLITDMIHGSDANMLEYVLSAVMENLQREPL